MFTQFDKFYVQICMAIARPVTFVLIHMGYNNSYHTSIIIHTIHVSKHGIKYACSTPSAIYRYPSVASLDPLPCRPFTACSICTYLYSTGMENFTSCSSFLVVTNFCKVIKSRCSQQLTCLVLMY